MHLLDLLKLMFKSRKILSWKESIPPNAISFPLNDVSFPLKHPSIWKEINVKCHYPTSWKFYSFLLHVDNIPTQGEEIFSLRTRENLEYHSLAWQTSALQVTTGDETKQVTH